MIVPKRNSILIFDTNIFLTGIDFTLIPSRLYTTPQVIEEIEVFKYKSKNRTILNRILVAVETGKLIVKSPIEKYYHRVEEEAKLTGDFMTLSKADIGVVALAIELKEVKIDDVIIYTNDYSIENLCLHLNLTFQPFYKAGIKKKYYFEMYCPYCHKIYDSSHLNKFCNECGSKLKRRALSSK